MKELRYILVLATMPILAALHTACVPALENEQKDVSMEISDKNNDAVFAETEQINSINRTPALEILEYELTLKWDERYSNRSRSVKFNFRPGQTKAGRSPKKRPRSNINKLLY